MSETVETPEIDYYGPITSVDRPMLLAFGLQWPDENEAQWMVAFNQVVETSSIPLETSPSKTPLSDPRTQARIAIIDSLTSLKPEIRDSLKVASYGQPVLGRTLIGVMRALYSDPHDIDALDVANSNSRLLLITARDIPGRLANFALQGLDVQKVAKVALSYPVQNTNKRIDALSAVQLSEDKKLDAIAAVNDEPWLIATDAGDVQERVDNMASLGLDPSKVVPQRFSVLKYRSRSFRTKFLLAKAVLRYWGASDEHAQALSIYEQAPSVSSNAPEKVRTLARIAATMLPSTALTEVEAKKIQPILKLKIEVVLAAYLRHKDKFPEGRPLANLTAFRAYVRTFAKQSEGY